MKMIKSTREFPFLLTVAALFVAALAHLGIQIWGSPDLRASLNALEAPRQPPKISSPTVAPEPPPSPPPSIETETALPQSELSTPDNSPAKLVVASDAAAPGDPTTDQSELKPPKISKAAESKSNVLAEKKSPAKQKNSAVEAAEVPEVKVVKAEPLKPAKKKPAKKKKDTFEEPARPEYVIPEEWNWFSKPLVMKNIGSEWIITTEDAVETNSSSVASHVEMCTDKNSVSSVATAIEEAKSEIKSNQPGESMVSKAATIEKSQESAQNHNKSVRDVEITPVAASESPFERALAKMASRKSKRQAEAERLAVVLPSGGGANAKVPTSLLKMIDTLNHIVGSPSSSSLQSEEKASSEGKASEHKISEEISGEFLEKKAIP